MRYTKSHIQEMFKRLLKALNKQQAPIMLLDNRDNVTYHPGGYSLDFSSTHGGYVIEEELELGGISHPFGCMRRSSREMYFSIHMAAMVVEDINFRKEQRIELRSELEW